MGRHLLRPLAIAALAAASASPAFAQGSSVYNQSACVSARGGAAIAAPCADASSVYYSPGALALMPSTLSAGFSAIYNTGSYTYDGTGEVVERDAAVPIVPQAYISYRFGADQRWAGAFGVWAPYGLGIEWPEEFEGKYASWKTQLRGIYLQPTISYQITPRLGIGAGPQIVLGGIELNQYLDAPVAIDDFSFLPLGTDIATAKLEGSGNGLGGQIGIYYEASDRLALGARYMHSVKLDLDGTADFTALSNPDVFVPVPGLGTVPLDAVLASQFQTGGAFADRDVEASLEFPAQAVVGVRFGATPLVSIMADYQWTQWSSFDRITTNLLFEAGGEPLALQLDYNDAHTFRLGTEFAAGPGLELRGGFVYNTAATPDQTVTPILPEAERQLYTLGIGYDLGMIRADAYYNYVNQADRRGRVRGELPGSYTIDDLNIGVYSATAHLFGLTLSYVFGAR
jgi:long-chain fatty acid transport protein